MSDYDYPHRQSPKWPVYLGFGCLALVILVVSIIFVSSYLIMRSFHNSMAIISAPIKYDGPYHYDYPGSTDVSLDLPENYGRFTYMHFLVTPKNNQYGEGRRGLKLVSENKTQEWPLPYSQMMEVKVGLYWHPEKNGKGPYLRICDATGTSVLDLQKRDVGALVKAGGLPFISYYKYNNTQFSSSYSETIYPESSQKPVDDSKYALSSKNSRYLGSIVQKGNKLEFVPAEKVKK